MAQKGLLDLTEWDFDRHGTVALNGEYEFYWQRFLDPRETADSQQVAPNTYINVPDSWNGEKIEGMELPGTGFATYRLTVLLPKHMPTLSLKFLDMATTFRVYVDGHESLIVGEPGTNAAESKPSYRPQLLSISPKSDRLDLMIHVSNFHHLKGGIWEEIYLGQPAAIRSMWGGSLAFDIFLFGAILMMALYHLQLYFFRRKGKSSLYFGLFSFLVAIRILVTEEIWLTYALPWFNWQWLVKIEYLSAFLAVPAFGMYMFTLFRDHFPTGILKAILGVSAVLSSVVLLTPVSIFSYLPLVFDAYIVLCLFVGKYILFEALRKGQSLEAAIFSGGFIILGLTVINDIIDISGLAHTGHLVGLGLFIFIFSQAALLSFRFTNAFTTIEDQHRLLGEMNNKYRIETEDRLLAQAEKQRLEEQLARSRKMEALGLLAGGVAHDLNNVLSGIVTYPELLLLDLSPDSKMYQQIDMIKSSGDRASAIVQDLLTLARRGVIQKEVLNLNSLIGDYIDSADYQKLRENYPQLEIVCDCEPQLLNIAGSRAHLDKTIHNLVANAAEAQEKGGTVTISTRNRYIDRPINGYQVVQEGNYIILRVTDNGTGISQEDVDRIFEPFYTRKIMGRRGTGLGMAVVWGTVQDHQGFVDVESFVGEGTQIELYFPVTEEALVVVEKELTLDEITGNGETVLIVDDIETQREIASQIISRLNYAPCTAESGEKAVEYLKDNQVDILVLDMIMEPGINGLETFRRAKRLHPDIKAIIASGFSETQNVRLAQELGAGAYVKKPYTIEKIGRAIKMELERQ